MRRSLYSIFVIILMAQAFLAMPDQGVEDGNEVMQQLSAYREKLRNLVLLSESVVNEHYDSLPQLQREFETYLRMLSDYKSSSSGTAPQTKEMLSSWFDLLAMIKDELAKTTVEVTTTKNYSSNDSNDNEGSAIEEIPNEVEEETTSEEETTVDSATNDSKQKLRNSKTIELIDLLNELEENELLTDTQKSLELVTRMADWDVMNDRVPFFDEVSALELSSGLKDIVFENQSLPILLAEYSRLMDMNDETLDSIPVYARYLEAFKIYSESSQQTKDTKISTTHNIQPEQSSSEEEIAINFDHRISNTTPTEESTSKKETITIDELLRDEKKKLRMNPKIVYLERQLNELRHSIPLTDSRKAQLLLTNMVEWDETYDRESFNLDVQSISRSVTLDDQTKIKLVTEFRRLNNLHMAMIKWDSSYESQFRIQSLVRYLNAFTLETEQLPPNNTNYLPGIQAGDSFTAQDFTKMLENSIVSQHLQSLPPGGTFVSHRIETYPIETKVFSQTIQTHPLGNLDGVAF